MLTIAIPLYIIAIELGIILSVYLIRTKPIKCETSGTTTIDMSQKDKEDFNKADQQATENFNSLIAELNAFMLDREVDTNAERQET